MSAWSPRRLGNIGFALLVISVLWGLFFAVVGLAALLTPPEEEDPLAGALQGIVGWVSIGIGVVGGTAAGLGGISLVRKGVRRARAAPPLDAGPTAPQA
jgi:hypothetical protein